MGAEKFNEYSESKTESMETEIKEAIRIAKIDEEKIYSSILWWKTDAINNFYKIDWEKWDKIVFNLNHVKDYLNDVFQRLSWMKKQKFWIISQENNFKWTILAIQIALKAIDSNKYNIQINGMYDDATKNIINLFQTTSQLKFRDWKPWKETIWKIIENLNKVIAEKEAKEKEQELLKNKIKEIIENSFKTNAEAWLLYSSQLVESMTKYIYESKLWTKENEELENDIKILSGWAFNWILKYLVEHPEEPITEAIKQAEQKQKEIDEKNQHKLESNPEQTNEDNPNNTKKETKSNNTWTKKEWWNENDKQKFKNYPWDLSNYPYNWWKFNTYTYWNNLTEGQKKEIDSHLKKAKSPLTVEMFQKASIQTKVPIEFILAFCQNDSTYWTIWDRAKRTKNPWNVGNKNNWSNTYYKTRSEWVIACWKHIQQLINKYYTFFGKLPTIWELATWIWPNNKRFHWVYMTNKNWQKRVRIIFSTRISRLKWK